jgi:hypothetical protein
VKTKIIAAVAIGVLVALSGSTAANAAGSGVSRTYLIDITKTTHVIKKTHAIAKCTIGSGGGTCNIQKGHWTTNTISVSLGMDVEGVAGELGASTAKTTTLTVGCNSPKLKPGESWVAYPIGTSYRYKIRHEVATFIGGSVTTSKWLTAYHAYSTQIYCEVVK